MVTKTPKAFRQPNANTIDQLYTTHRSIPANPLLAEVMYLRGAIERMGTGTEEMTKQCVAKGLGKPQFIPNYGFQTIIRRTNSQVTEQVTEQVQYLLKVLSGEMDRSELQEKLNLSHREYFRASYLQPAIEQGLVAMKFPQSLNHPKQKYHLTAKGLELKKKFAQTD